MFIKKVFYSVLNGLAIVASLLYPTLAFAANLNLASTPLFLSGNVPPLAMLVMGRDHKLYYEAYNDASDINLDGNIDALDLKYNPNLPDGYFGYFESNLCYDYDTSGSYGVFVAKKPAAADRSCADPTPADPSDPTDLSAVPAPWSGDFLNYVTTSRMDALRKVLYGGSRVVDTEDRTVLRRAYIPQDAHSWGKEYNDETTDGYDIRDYTPLNLPGTGRRHILANLALSEDGQPLMRIMKDTDFRVWQWLSIERPVGDDECFDDTNSRVVCNNSKGGTEPGLAVVDDYDVNIEVCDTAVTEALRDAGEDVGSCKAYAGGTTLNYKPTGVLQDKGETDEMMFGLITGSYENNLEGGVLRKRMGSLLDEFEDDSDRGVNYGIFDADTVGIIRTIDNLRIWGFNYTTVTSGDGYEYLRDPVSDRSSKRECTFDNETKLVNGDCNMWGNPIGEMMYEGLRYFAGAGAPTADFTYSDSSGVTESIDKSLGLPQPTWNDPYDKSNGGFEYCATPYQIVISDINPSYDSNNIPGTYSGFGDSTVRDSLDSLKDFAFETVANEISSLEGLNGSSVYIGHSGTNETSAPTAQTMSGLGSVRGLSPEEPTKEGSYSSAAIAYYARTNDISDTVADEFESDPNSRYKQYMRTFSVALASPLPEIKIPVGEDKFVTILPFAKSIRQDLALPANFTSADEIAQRDGFHSTNQIVDFYVQELTDTRGTFLINFEDVESGGDHDMDAIARYSYEKFTDALGGITIQVDVESIFAGGGTTQHMGYVISGTGDTDGIYLEVRDISGTETDKRYYLDTPPDRATPSDPRGNTLLLSNEDEDGDPFIASRVFTPDSGSGAATFLKGPLWYAAKYGGFEEDEDRDVADPADEDKRFDNIPNLQYEWAEKALEKDPSNADPDPDNYFLVTNALTLKEQLTEALNFKPRSASAATVTVSAGSLGSDTLLFQAIFEASDWSGEVKAISLDSRTGVLANTTAWLASERMNEQFVDGSEIRQVLSFNNEERKGVPFDWTAPANAAEDTLAANQLNELITGVSSGDEQDFVDYIRGDTSNEGSSIGDFRERPSLLGDIVHSNPVYVTSPGFFYADTWRNIGGVTAPENTDGVQQYSAFRAQFRDRNPMIYFGANDGIFHGIRATSDGDGGKEVVAYVPTPVFGNLSALADQDYQHQYYVDGPVNYGDVFFNGQWQTVVVGSLRGGGQGIFALDVTDPEGAVLQGKSFTEDNAESLVLWEFTDTDSDPSDSVIDGDVDLGYTFGKPLVVRMANGRWAAVFGNGYNNTVADGNQSASGRAAVYIVDIEDGSLIKKLETNVGAAEDPTGSARPNGIAHVTVIDANRDSIADYIYAPDLFGNVWKFDVSSADTTSWTSSFGSEVSPTPLYVAKTSTGENLPITTQIQVGRHPDPEFRNERGNVMLFFGTGQYIESSDGAVTGQLTQSFHGLWDNGSAPISGRNQLVEQEILGEPTKRNEGSPDLTLRISSDFDIDWAGGDRGWVIDLKTPAGGNAGERQVSDAVLRNGRIVFTTLIPDDDICQSGGTGWIMELDAANGGSIDDVSPFDIDGDGYITDSDLDVDGDGNSDEPVVGIFVATGIPTSPTIVDLPNTDGGGVIDNTGGGDSGGSDGGATGGSDGGATGGSNGGETGGSDGGGTGEAPPGDQTTEVKYFGESGGTILRLIESGDRSVIGRQSWREVR